MVQPGQLGHTRGIQGHPMDIDGYLGSKSTPHSDLVNAVRSVVGCSRVPAISGETLGFASYFIIVMSL